VSHETHIYIYIYIFALITNKHGMMFTTISLAMKSYHDQSECVFS